MQSDYTYIYTIPHFRNNSKTNVYIFNNQYSFRNEQEDVLNLFKKVLSVIAAFILTLITILTGWLNNTIHIYAADSTSTPPALHARYAALIDGDSNRLLFGKEADIKVPNASTTKIMTLITALEICRDDYIVTTSSYAASMPDVQLNAVKSEQFVINDLYYSLMLKSHNDTAVIIAENSAYYYICSLSDKERNELPYDISFLPDYNYDSSFIQNNTKEQSNVLVHIFVDIMNRKAHELGCLDTHFITPNGLDATDEYGVHSTTAYDLGIMMSYCIKNTDFLEITQSPAHTFSNLSGRTYSITNSNAFLSMYDNIISGKTGFTADAGYCYVCAYKDNERTFIVTLLACGWPNNKTYKWSDAKALLNYARANYHKETLIDNKITFNIPVKNGRSSYINTDLNEHYNTYLTNNDSVNITYDIPDYITAPVKSGDIIGTVDVKINDITIKHYNLICNENIGKITYLDNIFDIFRHFLFFLCILVIK